MTRCLKEFRKNQFLAAESSGTPVISFVWNTFIKKYIKSLNTDFKYD